MLRRKTLPLEVGREAMGIDWMTRAELSQAIPPAYTKWIGEQLISAIEEADRAQV
jgi:DNA (cytosine-5)-methyltransferase 1